MLEFENLCVTLSLSIVLVISVIAALIIVSVVEALDTPFNCVELVLYALRRSCSW